MPNPTDNNPEHVDDGAKSVPMPFKLKMIIVASTIFLAAGLAVGIYFLVNHFTGKIAVKKAVDVRFIDDSSLKIIEGEYL